MGIELPAELAGLASASGVRWPRADEDGMREQAAAWRKAADQLATVSSAADSSAVKAFSSISGETADAAGKHWNTLADPDSGALSSAVRGAHATADRLDTAAEQIGAAKVAMVRNLVDLAKNHDALHALGNPAAADTALRGTAANVAALHETLTKTVSGQDVPNPLAEPVPHANHGWTAPTPGDPGDGTQPGFPGARHEDQPGAHDGSQPGAPGAHDGSGSAPPSGKIAPGNEFPDAGSATQHQFPAGGGAFASGGGAHADFPGDAADTGPLPIQGRPQAGSVSAASAATAIPLGHTPAGYDVPTPRSGLPQQPFVPQQPDASVPQPPAQPLPPQPPAPPPPAQPSAQPQGPAQPVARSAQPPRQSAARPLRGFEGSPQVRPNPVAAQESSSAKPRDRDVEVIALFRIHMFPIGHMPKPRHRPLRQLPAPESEYDHAPGLRFPPQDHPRSELVSDQDALTTHPPHQPASTSVHELDEDYHPLGEHRDRDWDRRFLVRAAESGDGAAEYAWPPGEMHPEGGCGHGEPLVLEPGTELDRFGTGEGRVFSTPETSFAQRSLPPDCVAAEYRRYRVLRPLPVWWAISAAWFGQPGGGPRYRTTYAAADLVALGYLAPLGDNDER